MVCWNCRLVIIMGWCILRSTSTWAWQTSSTIRPRTLSTPAPAWRFHPHRTTTTSNTIYRSRNSIQLTSFGTKTDVTSTEQSTLRGMDWLQDAVVQVLNELY